MFKCLLESEPKLSLPRWYIYINAYFKMYLLFLILFHFFFFFSWDVSIFFYYQLSGECLPRIKWIVVITLISNHFIKKSWSYLILHSYLLHCRNIPACGWSRSPSSRCWYQCSPCQLLLLFHQANHDDKEESTGLSEAQPIRAGETSYLCGTITTLIPKFCFLMTFDYLVCKAGSAWRVGLK